MIIVIAQASQPTPSAWGGIGGPLIWVLLIIVLASAIQDRRNGR